MTTSWTLGIIIFGFNVWNWFLAITGQTTIEFWGMRMAPNDERSGQRFDFTYKHYMDNLYVIFGTRNILKMLLFTGIGPLPSNGVYWDNLGLETNYENGNSR